MKRLNLLVLFFAIFIFLSGCSQNIEMTENSVSSEQPDELSFNEEESIISEVEHTNSIESSPVWQEDESKVPFTEDSKSEETNVIDIVEESKNTEETTEKQSSEEKSKPDVSENDTSSQEEIPEVSVPQEEPLPSEPEISQPQTPDPIEPEKSVPNQPKYTEEDYIKIIEIIISYAEDKDNVKFVWNDSLDIEQAGYYGRASLDNTSYEVVLKDLKYHTDKIEKACLSSETPYIYYKVIWREFSGKIEFAVLYS